MSKRIFGMFGLLFLLAGIISMFPIFGAVRTYTQFSHLRAVQSTTKAYTFPKAFLWGTATAAQQIEGQSPSDWTAFELEVYRKKRFEHLGKGRAKPKHIANLGNYGRDVLGRKTNFDVSMERDLEMLKKMKHNAYRFSISWSRLFPTPSKEPSSQGLAYYKRLFTKLKQLKIKPMVTLFHFS
ncbi:MAG: family 1 glycosylhydrolase, partial [Myxococcota bacterium]